VEEEADLLISPDHEAEIQKSTAEFTSDEDEKKRVAAITDKYEEGRRAKAGYERTWFISGCFVVGHHNVTWNDIQRMFDIPIKMSPFRVRLVINHILAYFRRTKARLTGAKPGVWVRPASTDEKDVERSRTQSKVLDYEFDRMGHQEKLKEGVGWALEASCWCYHLKWNPFAGPKLYDSQPVVDQETGEPQFDPETGEPQMQQIPVTDEYGRHVHRGENELEIVSPYEIVVDPRAKSLETAEWMIRSAVRSLSWIRENYPDKGRFVKGKKEHLNSLYEQRLRNVIGIDGSNGGEAGIDLLEDSSVVYEYWEKPTSKHEEGRCVVTAGDVELFVGHNPYEHKQFPYVMVGEVMVPGRFWPLCMIEQLIPLQKNYNRGRSQEVENRTLHGRPKILEPKTAKMSQDAFDAEPGEKIKYTPGPRGEKPELLIPPSTSQATQAEIAQTLSDFQDVGSYHEASKGILPSANIPGVGIERLQMADDTALGDTAGNIEIGVVKLGKMVLSNCGQFWDEERMVRAGGEIARMESMNIRGDDLTGPDPAADYGDVQVQPQSTLLKDPAKQRENVKSMVMEMKVLDPVLHREKILKMLDVKDIDEIFADNHLDEQRAQQENELMASGQPVMPRDFENHTIHMQILDRFRKSERYRRLPPQIQKIFDNHAQMHVQLAILVMQQSAQGSAIAQGNHGEEGEEGEEGGPEEQPSQGEE